MKFKIGDIVKFKNEKEAEGGKIVSFYFNEQIQEITYVFTAKEWDMKLKKIIEGVRHGNESALELYNDES